MSGLNTCVVVVTIQDTNGNLIEDASVDFFESADTALADPVSVETEISEDEMRVSLDQGSYIIRVSASGLKTQVRYCDLNGWRLKRESFVLGTEQMPSYFQGEKEIPFTPLQDKAVLSITGSEPSEALQYFLDSNSIEIVDKKGDLLFLQWPSVSETVLATLQQEILLLEGIKSSGLLVYLDELRFAYLPGEIVTEFVDSVSREDVADIFTEYSFVYLPGENFPGKYSAQYSGFANLSFIDAVNGLRNDERVFSVSTLIVTSNVKTAPNDFLFPNLWHLQLIRVEQAWEALETAGKPEHGDPTIVLAVNDFRLELGEVNGQDILVHADFIDNVSNGSPKLYHYYDFHTFGGSVDYNPSGGQTSGHGTMVASIVSGNAQPSSSTDLFPGVTGVAPNTRLMAHVLGTSNAGNDAYFIWASGLKPNFPILVSPANLQPYNPSGLKGPVAINNSWGFGDVPGGPDAGNLDPFSQESLNTATTYGRMGRGIFNVFSSGNTHLRSPQNSPRDINNDSPHAKYSKTIAVGASSIGDDGITEIRAAYSYHGARFSDYFLTVYDSGPGSYIRDPNPSDVKLLDFVAPGHDRYTDLTDLIPSSRIDVHPYNYAITAAHFLHGALMEEPGDSANFVGTNVSLTTSIKEALPASLGIISVRDTSAFYPEQYLIIGTFPSSYEINQVDSISQPWDIINVIKSCNHLKLDHDAATSYGVGTAVIGLTGVLPEDHSSYQNIVVTNVFTGVSEIEVTNRAGFVAGQVLFIGDPTASSGVRERWEIVGDGSSSANSLQVTLVSGDGFTLGSGINGLPVYIMGGEIQTKLDADTANVPSPPTPLLSQTITVKSTARLREGFALMLGIVGSNTSENCVITGITSHTTLVVNRLFRKHLNGKTVFGGRASYANTMGGTSASAPQATGLAGLLLSANPNLTWVEIRDMMRKTASPIGLTASSSSTTGAWQKPNGALINASSFSNPATAITLSANAAVNDTTITVSGVAELKPRMLIRLEDGTNTEVKIIRRMSVGNVLSIDPLVNAFSSGITSVKVGNIVHYSNYMGFGRLDAELAVQEALAYSHSDRDLMIRDRLVDDGTSATPSNIKIDSPDIWVRYTPHSVAELNTIAGQTTEGPHRQPIKGTNRRVYVRVKNRGNKYTNLDAWVRCYVCTVPVGTEIKFPEHFIDSAKDYGLPQGSHVTVKQLLTANGREEYFLQEDLINPGDSDIAEFVWPANTLDESTKRETIILAMVSPFDGPFFGAGNTVKTITDCNNLSRKKVVMVEKTAIYNDLTPPGALKKKVEIPADDIATPISTGFKIDIRNTTPFDPQGIIIKAKFEKLNGSTEEVTFRFDSGAWGFEAPPPTGGWFQCDPPLRDPFGPTDLVNTSTSETEVIFNGSFTVNYEYSSVTITVTHPFGSPLKHTVDVKVVHAQNSDADSEKTKLHFFTDIDLLDIAQAQSKSYGPVTGSETTKFQVTSQHTATVVNIDPSAYAVCDGRVLVQRNEDHPTTHVNLILKPENQGAVDFLNVQYFVYRGIKRDSLVDPDNITMAPQLTNDFTDAVWQDQDSLNRHRETANSLPVNSITDKPTVKALGLHFVDSPVGVDEVQKLNADLIDQLFFNPGPDFRAIWIGKGKKIGKFDKTGFGFDVITDGLGFVPNFGMVRKDKHVIEANAAVTSPPLQKLISDKERVHVLNFIDPCAFYGIHFNNRLFVHQSGNTVDKITGNDIYDQVLVKFFNKDAVYLDIRNENGYPYNYYGNYGTQDILVALQDDNSVVPTPAPTTNTWPLYIFRDSNFTGTSPNTSEKNIIRLSLPKGDNDKPLLYMAYAHPYADYPARPKGKTKFSVPAFPGIMSDEIRLGVPNRSGLSVTAASSWYVKLYYIRRVGATVPANEPKVNTGHFFDLLFPVTDVTTWNSPDGIEFISGVNERFMERDDFACMAETGVAIEPGRYVFFAVPTDVYFAGGNITALYKGISGGTSDKPSIFESLKGIFPGLTLKKRQLATSPVIEYLTYESNKGVGDPLIKNFIGIGVSSVEFQDILNDITSTSIDSSLHYPALVVKQVSTLADGDDTGYYQYELAVAGIKTDGSYVISTDTYEAHSVDNLMITTQNFANAETATGDVTRCIEFKPDGKDTFDSYTNFGKVIKRIRPFINSGGALIKSWKLLDDTGVIQTYGAGESTNLDVSIVTGSDIEIPVGIRLVLLDCKTLPVLTQGSINYIRVVCYYNKKYREGYISEHAVTDNDERVIGIENLTDDEIFDAFVNDAIHEVQLITDISSEHVNTGPDYVPYTNLINSVTTQLGDAVTFGSLISAYATGSIIQKTAITDKIKELSSNSGLGYGTYFDQKTRKPRIDIPETLNRFNQMFNSTGLTLSTNFFVVPFNLDWSGSPNPAIASAEGYDDGIKAHFSANSATLMGDLTGNSGSSQGIPSSSPTFTDPEETLNKQKQELKSLRDYIIGRSTTDPTDPLVATPEAVWLMAPGFNNTYIASIECIVYISHYTWHSPRTNFRAEGILIDQSFGTVDSNNVLSVLIHEYNVSAGIKIGRFNDHETHFHDSESLLPSGSKKSVPQTSWEYTRDNDFALFSSHGFLPTTSYLDSAGKALGNDNDTKTQAIRDFLQRNPGLGLIYLKYLLDKIMQ
jgi:hypothetical protein